MGRLGPFTRRPGRPPCRGPRPAPWRPVGCRCSPGRPRSRCRSRLPGCSGRGRSGRRGGALPSAIRDRGSSVRNSSGRTARVYEKRNYSGQWVCVTKSGGSTTIYAATISTIRLAICVSTATTAADGARAPWGLAQDLAPAGTARAVGGG
ncbi:peptidase inhibitor family I36 protein [Streptomyces sp. 5-6(2022)]|uniref:peptidase inhibitor family I36 protein n=1 Tax=Streptomyces sp. 5-6(2022) TaxID=2936510 RepID=UPI0023B93DFE|nr:peptidase inhibitor family I36 protein [Streptomyces sp. 5-6(2022)]